MVFSSTSLFRRGLFRALGAVVFALPVISLLAALPVEGATAGDPRSFVNGLGDEVIGILKTPGVNATERQQRFRALFTQSFDAQAIGRFVLGAYWNRASEAERQRYLNLFSDYVAAIYAIQFSHYDGASFKTEGVSPIGNGDQAVTAEIDRSDQPSLQVVFRVRSTPQGQKIVDVAVNSISLIVTKREEFAEVLATQGVQGIMQRMQAVLDRTKSNAG
jgi:phospholipid transport system substrate-binding protein